MIFYLFRFLPFNVYRIKWKTNESVETTEIRVEVESEPKRQPQKPQQQQQQQSQSQSQQQNQEPIEAEYSSDDDIASPELDLHDADQSEKKPSFALDDELLSEEDEEEDEEEVSSEGNDYDSESSVDDSALLKRLEEKYGKLPQRSNSDVDDDDNDNDDEDIDPTWTSTLLEKIQLNRQKYETNPIISNRQT